MHRYEITIFWSDEDDTFIAEVPELAGCKAHGSSQKEALENAQEAVDLWLDTAREFGEPIPESKDRRLMYA
ncbi:MAG: type II toxin-antitoxin system HicB family antitoxin [Xanthomonadales bacterium]|nr:type II toxin-antitoxin system HicB family antitoxin [Xanthomonadales bacterium]